MSDVRKCDGPNCDKEAPMQDGPCAYNEVPMEMFITVTQPTFPDLHFHTPKCFDEYMGRKREGQ